MLHMLEENMGLFNKVKVKIIEERHNERTDYILDCMKVNEPMVLGKRVLQEFSKGKKLYLFLDSNFAFERDHRVVEKNIENIQDRLDEVGISYVSKDRMVEKTQKIVGIPMKKKMVKEYKVVISATEEIFDLISFIFPRQSFFGYIIDDEKTEEEIFRIHDRIHSECVDYSEFLEKKELQVFTYFDNYFSRIRIATESETDIRMIQRIIKESYES